MAASSEPEEASVQGSRGAGPFTLLLIAAILMGVIGVWMSRGASTAAPASLWGERSAADRLLAQFAETRTALLSCVQQYPGGSNGIGGRPDYPGGVGVALSALTCPGAPAARRPLWGGSYGVFLQPGVLGYDWTYANDAGGVRFVVTAATAGQAAALSRVAQRLGNAEAAVDLAARTLTLWIVR